MPLVAITPFPSIAHVQFADTAQIIYADACSKFYPGKGCVHPAESILSSKNDRPSLNIEVNRFSNVNTYWDLRPTSFAFPPIFSFFGHVALIKIIEKRKKKIKEEAVKHICINHRAKICRTLQME